MMSGALPRKGSDPGLRCRRAARAPHRRTRSRPGHPIREAFQDRETRREPATRFAPPRAQRRCSRPEPRPRPGAGTRRARTYRGVTRACTSAGTSPRDSLIPLVRGLLAVTAVLRAHGRDVLIALLLDLVLRLGGAAEIVVL